MYAMTALAKSLNLYMAFSGVESTKNMYTNTVYEFYTKNNRKLVEVTLSNNNS